MQGAGGRHLAMRLQHKQGHGHLKAMTVGRDKKEAAMHGAVRGANARAAGVLEGLPRVEQRLLADHAQAFDFFCVALRVVDDPVPGDQLRGNRACVGEAYRIGEMVEALPSFFRRRKVSWRGFNLELVGQHPCMVTATISA